MIKLNNLLNEVKISEGLEYHIKNDISLEDCVFRYGSKKYFTLMNEAKALMNEGTNFDNKTKALLETDLGEFGMYEGKEVALDFPMINEEREDYVVVDKRNFKPLMMNHRDGFYEKWSTEEKAQADADELNRAYQKTYGAVEGPHIVMYKSDYFSKKRLSEEYYVTYNKGRGQGKGLITTKESDYTEPRVFSKEEAEEYVKRAKSGGSMAGQITAYWVSDKDMNRVDEASKKKKKDPPLGKPKRGGSKAYYVYVRDPKTKRIKKVSFGSGGLRAKINDPKKRKAFAARHKCSQKTDRTKASYWACRVPRYAKQLGLSVKNPGAFW